MSKLLQHIRNGIIILVVTVLLLEIALRILGWGAFHFPPFSIVSEPKGALIPHATLGLALRPGTYQVTINEHLHYQATHTQDSTRITNPPPLAKDEILLYGCSFTYGMGVDDSLTFAYLLQQRLPYQSIINKGVPGYGTVQAYLDLQQLLQDRSRPLPSSVVVLYASFHNERNVLSPHYREHLYYGFLRSDEATKKQFSHAAARIPFARWEQGSMILDNAPFSTLYQPIPLREYSAIMNVLQQIINQQATTHLQADKVTAALLVKMQQMCQVHGIDFVVASVVRDADTQQMLQQIRKQGVAILDMGLDILHDRKYNNLPHDSHPNAVAHAVYAEALFWGLGLSY